MLGGQRIEHPVKGISLRSRLTIWVVTIFVTIQLVTGLGFWTYQRAATLDFFEERLRERAGNIAGEVESQLPNLTRGSLDAIATRELGNIQFERFEVDVLDEQGDSVVRDQVRWPDVVPLALDAIETGSPSRGQLARDEIDFELFDGQRGEAIALPLIATEGTRVALVVVTSDAYVHRQTSLIARVLIAGSVIGIIASCISGWFIAGIAVEPLRSLVGVAEQLGPENIDEKIVVDSPVAEIEELTEELNAARARIREAFAAQERFLSNISHELKTPIATILTEAQTMDRSGLGEEGNDFVDLAEDEMRKLGRLVESFLTLTRVRDGAGVAKPKFCYANELVMDSVEDCISMADQHAVRLVPELATDDDAFDARLMGDPPLLQTMLNNLVRNAIRFSPDNGRVFIRATLFPERFEVAVRDQGPGLPPEILDHVFDRFVQSSDEIRRERGHGLGLAIAKGIAELHHGDIRVRNADDGGAEFIVWLPIVGATPGPGPNAVHEDVPNDPSPNGGTSGNPTDRDAD